MAQRLVVDDDLRMQNRPDIRVIFVTPIMTKQFAAGPWSKAPRTFSSKPLDGAERLRSVDECSEEEQVCNFWRQADESRQHHQNNDR